MELFIQRLPKFAAFYLILGALCWLAGLGNKKPRDENK